MDKPHPFEAAGLGKAPFHFLFVRENVIVHPGLMHHVQPGGTCDYCSTGIRYEFHCQGADGQRFKVGCDCVSKLNWEANREFIAQVESARLRVQREQRQAKAKAKREAAQQRLQGLEQDARAALKDDAVAARLVHRPHPVIEGKSLLDYVEWCLTYAGKAGREKAARIVLEAVA